MRSILLSLSLLLAVDSILCAQKFDAEIFNSSAENYFFAGTAVYSKLKIVPRMGYGSDHLKSKPGFGYQAGYMHSFVLGQHLQLSTGVKLQIAGRNHQMYIPKGNFLPPLTFDVDDYGLITREYDFFPTIPVLFKYFKVVGKSIVRLGAGIDVNLSPVTVDDAHSYYQYNQNNQLTGVYEMNLKIGEKKLWVNPALEFGYGYLLKNHHSVEASLNWSPSFSDVVKGRYLTYTSGATPSDGTFSARHSYLALFFSYHLSKYKKRMAK